MATGIQVVFDCADPDSLARFWAEAIGYKLQDPPTGYGSWEHWARDQGVPQERWNDVSAVDPDNRGPRLYLQRVPEAKTTKNRVHLTSTLAAAMARRWPSGAAASTRRSSGCWGVLLWLLAVGGVGGGRVGSGWTVLGGELAVPCTRNPL